MAKSWREKLYDGRTPHVERIDRKFADIEAGASVLIATPLVVKKFIEAIPEGSAVSVLEMRRRLAERFQADAMCPLTAGIFLRIISEFAWDEIQAGEDPGKVTPFWRIVEPRSPLAKKLRCGPDFLRKMRAGEGLPL
jgi:hypothetical protein